VQADRDRGFDPSDVPTPEAMEQARAFAAWVAAVA
jgi:hypothetical protein